MTARLAIVALVACALVAPSLSLPAEKVSFKIRTFEDYRAFLRFAADRLGVEKAAVGVQPNINCTYISMCDVAHICRDVCQHGSVVLDQWAVNALRTQRLVNMDVQLQNIQMPGTHNSAISYAEGHGLEDEEVTQLLQKVDKSTSLVTANHQVSIVDQMRMGIRQIEVDVHWWDGDLRVCHAGGVHLQELNKLVQDIASALHITIDWDSETLGCFGPADRTFDAVLTEMRAYIDTIPEDIIVLFFDNEDDLGTWNKSAEFVTIASKHFADIAFTPADKEKFPGAEWPTPRQMLALGKRMLLLSGTNYGDVLLPNLFYKYGPAMNDWSEFGPGDFNAAYPACTLLRDNNTIHTDQGIFLRMLADSTIYGPFYYGPSGGLLTASNTPPMVECNLQYPCLDQMVPEDSAWFVWSWAQNEPAASHPSACAALDSATHRWVALPCDKSLPVLCQSTSDRHTWTVATTPVAWSAAASACPAGYAFATPTDGLMNRRVADSVTVTGPFWMSFSQF